MSRANAKEDVSAAEIDMIPSEYTNATGKIDLPLVLNNSSIQKNDPSFGIHRNITEQKDSAITFSARNMPNKNEKRYLENISEYSNRRYPISVGFQFRPSDIQQNESSDKADVDVKRKIVNRSMKTGIRDYFGEDSSIEREFLLKSNEVILPEYYEETLSENGPGQFEDSRKVKSNKQNIRTEVKPQASNLNSHRRTSQSDRISQPVALVQSPNDSEDEYEDTYDYPFDEYYPTNSQEISTNSGVNRGTLCACQQISNANGGSADTVCTCQEVGSKSRNRNGCANIQNEDLFVFGRSQSSNAAALSSQLSRNVLGVQRTTGANIRMGQQNVGSNQNSAQNNNANILVTQNSGSLVPLQTNSQNVNTAGVVANQQSVNVAPVQNTNSASIAVTQTSAVGPAPNSPQNSNSANVLINQNQNVQQSVPQNSNGANIAVSVNSGVGVAPQSVPQNTNSASIAVTQNAGVTSPVLAVNQNINNANIDLSQNFGTAGPLSIPNQNFNSANVVGNQIPLQGNNINSVDVAVSQQSSPVQTIPQNINSASVIVNQQTGPAQTIPQNTNSAGVVVNQQTGPAQTIPQNINSAGVVVNQQTGPAQTLPQNINSAGVVVSQQSNPVQTIPQNINSAGVVVSQQSNPVQTTPQNTNNAGVVVSQQSNPVQTIPQNTNNAGVVVSQQSNPVQTIPQNINSAAVFVSQQSSPVQTIPQNINSAGVFVSQQASPFQVIPQNLNSAGVFVNQQSSPSQTIPQNINSAGVAVTQNSGILSPISTQSTANVLLNQNSGALPFPNNLNSADILVNQRAGSVQTTPQSINLAPVLVQPSNDFFPLQTSRNMNSAGITVTQQNGRIVQIPAQNINENLVLTQQSLGLPSSQNLNSGLVTINQQSNNLSGGQVLSRSSNIGDVIVTQLSRGNSIIGSSQTNNNANLLVAQNLGLVSPLLPGSQNINTGTVLVDQSGNVIPVRVLTRNSDTGAIVVNQQSGNIRNSDNVAIPQQSGSFRLVQNSRNSNSGSILLENGPSAFNGDSEVILVNRVSDTSPSCDCSTRNRNIESVHVAQQVGSSNQLPSSKVSSSQADVTTVSKTGVDNGKKCGCEANKCSCSSIIPPDIDHQDKVIIIMPASDEQKYSKVVSSLVGSQRVDTTDSGTSLLPPRPYIYEPPPYFYEDYYERNPVPYAPYIPRYSTERQYVDYPVSTRLTKTEYIPSKSIHNRNSSGNKVLVDTISFEEQLTDLNKYDDSRIETSDSAAAKNNRSYEIKGKSDSVQHSRSRPAKNGIRKSNRRTDDLTFEDTSTYYREACPRTHESVTSTHYENRRKTVPIGHRNENNHALNLKPYLYKPPK